jgi:RNA polymerase sigma-70 factor (ECF subfamily)
MTHPGPDTPLNRISTLWTLVGQAHGRLEEAATTARRELLERYRRAVHRYLLGALHDPHSADELTQEFALRFMQGDYHGADPKRGRFRDFVKGVLFHLLAAYHKQRRRHTPLPAEGWEPAAAGPDIPDLDQPFLDSWRDELLNRAWKALEQIQQQTGQPFFAVLRFRAEHPDLRSAQMAEQLTVQLGKPATAPWVRQTLHRARDKFADLLLQDVAQTLHNPTAEGLEQELIDLGLLAYCQPALARYRREPEPPPSPSG